MKKYYLLTMSAISAAFMSSAAWAGDITTPDGQSLSIEQAGQMLHYSGGNDRARIELAPNYSEDLGWSMKGAAGAYLTDAIALGLIVEYGENKQEYLGNAGIQFTDALSLVGTVGLLEEDLKFDDQSDRTNVQQMEYGASFKGAYEVGFLSGFEVNGYLTNAESGSDAVEAGKLYGVQLLADLDLTSTTHVKLGGGYEWLRWDEGDENDSFAFSADASQQLGDMVSLNGNVKLGASEYVYGGGVALDLSRGGLNTNTLGLNYSYIEGRNGVEDDQRVELAWSYGFGAGPTQTASVETQDAGAVRPTADAAMVSPANNLLSDVMQRPKFLPQQVIARAKKVLSESCTVVNTLIGLADGGNDDYAYISIDVSKVSNFQVFIDGVLNTDYALNVDGGTIPNTSTPWSSRLYWEGDVLHDHNFHPEFPSTPVTIKYTVDGACEESTSETYFDID